MTTAHTLFHHDSRHLLTYLHQHPTTRREHSLILCTALMRAAALDLNEQGDVWAQVVEHRNAGAALHRQRERGSLTRGLRAVIALHVIFHWNRLGLPATTQATLAQAALEAIFGLPDPHLPYPG